MANIWRIFNFKPSHGACCKPQKLPIHRHFLLPSVFPFDCYGCSETKFDAKGYYCSLCEFYAHKECAESPSEINHPSHSHALKLSCCGPPSYSDGSCDLCGETLKLLVYHCSICNFSLDTACARKHEIPSIWRIFNFKPSHGASSKPLKLPIHRHFLEPSVFSFECCGCSETKIDAKGYSCPRCEFYAHKECAESPSEINHPSHSHALKLRCCGPPSYSDGSCGLCGEILKLLVYHCSICNFSLDTACARKHEIPSIDKPKAHEHKLHLLAKRVSFPCPCGKDVRAAPYLCHQCNFMIHRDCVSLPRVIHLTRHKHRISRSYFIGPGEFVCGVCRLRLNGRYGGYRCSVCPDYVIHLRCATREDVWDGKDLEGIPEEEEDIEEPFQVVKLDKGIAVIIKHFSHEDHNLKLNESGVVCHESIRCSACALPVYSYAYYKCCYCAFVLHETCAAKLPRKLRHELHKHTLTLRPNTSSDDENGYNLFNCTVCKRLCSGFKYVCECCDVEIDVRCCSIREPFRHESHGHPLFLTSSEAKLCGACNENASTVLNCVDCEFALGFDCATLPNKVKHKCDTHFLSVCFGEESSGKYWCEVCEGKVDPSTRFYTCEDCSSTLHINCVIGEFTFWRPGFISVSFYEVTVLPNVFASRPTCRTCLRRCEDTSGVIYISDKYLCSSICLGKFLGCSITLSKSPTQEISRFGQLFQKFLGFNIPLSKSPTLEIPLFGQLFRPEPDIY